MSCVGRPLKYNSAKEVKKKIDEYFKSCYKENEETGEIINTKPLTITGLANSLGITRETLLAYENGTHIMGDKATNGEISDTIKRAKSLVEQFAEEQLFLMRNPAGAIFNLINNYKGWSNKQEVITTSQPERITLDEIEKLEE